MKISYPFPIVCLDEEDPEEGEIIQCSGLLTPIRVDHEPYEAVVEARGYRFHILFGSQSGGNFLCIPDWQLGCELADIQDLSWNINSILHTGGRLDYEDATAIVYAMAFLDKYICQS